MKIATESIILKSDGSDMGVYIARPESKKAPGLILFQEAFGVNDHIKDVARRFAEQGYVTAAPELFHRTAPPGFVGEYGNFPTLAPHFQAVTTDGIANDARAVHEWLLQDSQVDNTHIGSMGSVWADAAHSSQMQNCRYRPPSHFMAEALCRRYSTLHMSNRDQFCSSGVDSISTLAPNNVTVLLKL